MLGNGHVRFGRRAAETGQLKDRYRAAARPHTEHPTAEGKLYCCVVLDLFSRKAVGWSIDRRCEAALVNDALAKASGSRPARPGTVIHSDHGSQGGFNRSSQHLDSGGVDGQASWVDDGVDWAVADEVAWCAGASTGCGARVLA
jgi:Integrase core domain